MKYDVHVELTAIGVEANDPAEAEGVLADLIYLGMKTKGVKVDYHLDAVESEEQ